MKALIVFEWKKIIQRKLNIVAMIMGYVVMGICLFSFITEASFYVEETDSYVHGVSAYHENRIKNERMTEYLTEEYVTDVITQIQDKKMDLESDDVYVEIIRPIGDLFYDLGNHYMSSQEVGKYNRLNEVELDNGARFYERRMEKIEETLNMDYSFGNYSEEEKTFWLNKASKIQLPFAWGDVDAMDSIWMLISVSFYFLFVIMICVSPVFASEYESGAVALLLTTKHGKNKLVTAKILTALIFTVTYFVVGIVGAVGIFIAIVGVWGVQLPIQLVRTTIPYDWTIGQTCVVAVAIIILITLALTLLMIMLSSRTKGSMITMVISLTIMIAPAFFPMSKESGLWNHINYLFPVRAIAVKDVISVFNSYQFGTVVISYLGMIVIVYSVIAILSLCGIKNGFVKHQVNK